MPRYIETILRRRGVTCVAALLDDRAPRTCRAVWEALPPEGDVYHAKYAGNEFYTLVPAFQALGLRRVAVASPYLPEVEAMLADFIQQHGVTVVASESLHLPEDHSIVPVQEMAKVAVAADQPDAEAVVIGCSGQRRRWPELHSARQTTGRRPATTATHADRTQPARCDLPRCLPDRYATPTPRPIREGTGGLP